MQQRTVIVSGASGLLGRGVVRSLAASDWHVIALARSAGAVQADCEILEVDFSTGWDTKQLPARVDAVMHLAQSHSYRDFPAGALDVFRVNVDATARLLDYARQAGATQFVYASSGGVYGNGSQAFRENAPITPPGKLGYYLGSKAAGEILVQSYTDMFNVVVLRPFFIYGAGQSRGMLVPRLVDSVREGKPIRVQGLDGIRINPVHVKDSAAATAAALGLERSAIFNIAGPDVMSIREICEGIGRYVGREPVFVTDPGEPRDLVADISAMVETLHDPKRRLLELLDEML
jgi:UDP-glucose 4-epimerase